jgi:hypothetical protein
MAGNQDIMLEAIENPDLIASGGQNEFIAIKHYVETSISEKHLVVIYDGFVKSPIQPIIVIPVKTGIQ